MSLEVILFDLDDTLYPREAGVMKEVGRRIQVWLCDHLDLTWERARVVRRDYFQRYGTTLGGLIAEHDVDVLDFLDFVHDIPVGDYLSPNPALAQMLAALPLRRAIYTNATVEYGWRVSRALEVADCFERIVGIDEVGLRNKIHPDAYERALALLDAQAAECIMVEDSARNLAPAKALGMTTVLVGPDGANLADVDFQVESVLGVGGVVQDLLGARKQ